jgi:hypothetical protein
MNRQELFLKIRKKVKENRTLEKIITSKDFLDYPENKDWKENFDKYKKFIKAKSSGISLQDLL